MKKNILNTLLIGGVMLLSGCENNFDAKIYGSLSMTNFPKSESDCVAYLMDCYEPFQSTWGYSLGGTWYNNFYSADNGIIRFFDSTTDECAPWTTSDTWGGDDLYMTSGNFENMVHWGRSLPHYEKIREVTRMAVIINTLEETTVLSGTKKKELVGEARLLRGLTMYYLFHMYGPVPVIIDPTLVGNNEAEKKLVRPSLNEMTQYITDDFEFAVSNMPEKQADKGRYTADYARFCLMRHYLNEGAHMEGYYENAFNLYSQFTGGYSLFQNGPNSYAEQFMIANKFNNGIIMALPCTSASDASGRTGNANFIAYYVMSGNVSQYDDQGNPTPFVKQTSGGWGQKYNIDKQFYATFEENDLRKKTIITSYHDNRGYWCTPEDIGTKWSGFIINKFPVETTTTFQGTDIPLARWADVLLMFAEADVRKNNAVSSSAVNCVNQVRHCAGLEDLSADKTSSVDKFMDALLIERGHELMYEGCRKIDLIRFNKYYTIMTEYGRTPTSQYFPIPNYSVNQAAEAGYELSQYFSRDDYDGPKK